MVVWESTTCGSQRDMSLHDSVLCFVVIAVACPAPVACPIKKKKKNKRRLIKHANMQTPAQESGSPTKNPSAVSTGPSRCYAPETSLPPPTRARARTIAAISEHEEAESVLRELREDVRRHSSSALALCDATRHAIAVKASLDDCKSSLLALDALSVLGRASHRLEAAMAEEDWLGLGDDIAEMDAWTASAAEAVSALERCEQLSAPARHKMLALRVRALVIARYLPDDSGSGCASRPTPRPPDVVVPTTLFGASLGGAFVGPCGVAAGALVGAIVGIAMRAWMASFTKCERSDERSNINE
jgi:hypothetical protein